MNIAVIPARGGSERIPRKNIKQFAGRPMISHSIATARASSLFDQVVVSTDDSAIAEIAIACGAEVPFRRPDALADAHTSTMDVMRHAVRWLQEQGGRFEYVCCIYATAPFLRPRDLARGLARLTEAPEVDFAFSVTSFAFPIQRALRIRPDHSVEAFWPEYLTCRSQDLEPAFHDAGQFYWGRSAAFTRSSHVVNARSVAVELPRWLVHDIDTPEDWTAAEMVYTSAYAAIED